MLTEERKEEVISLALMQRMDDIIAWLIVHHTVKGYFYNYNLRELEETNAVYKDRQAVDYYAYTEWKEAQA